MRKFNQNKRSVLKKASSKLNESLMGVVSGQLIDLIPSNFKIDIKSHYVLFKGIDLLADNLAQLPLYIYKNNKQLPSDFTFPDGFDIQQPHPNYSINELLYMGVTYLFYRGEFMLHINKELGPIFLDVINPFYMKKIDEYHWEYNNPTKNKQIILSNDLIYTKLFDPDGDRGISPMEVVRNEILNDTHAINYSSKFFENFTQIGGTLFDKDGKISDESMQRLVDQFNNARAGSHKAFKTLGLPKGIEYKEPTQTMIDMEFLEGRKDIRDRILSLLGIHKSLFGVTDQVNRAVAEEAARQMWIFNLRPKAIKIQEKLNQKLFKTNYPGYKCYFDFSAIEDLNRNMESIMNQAKAFRELGYTTNEINNYFDLGMDIINDPILDGRFIPNNLSLIEEEKEHEELIITPPEKKEEDEVKKKDDKEEKHLKSFLNKIFAKELNIIIKRIIKENASNKQDIMNIVKDTISKHKQTIYICNYNINSIFNNIVKLIDRVIVNDNRDTSINTIRSVYKFCNSKSTEFVKCILSNNK